MAQAAFPFDSTLPRTATCVEAAGQAAATLPATATAGAGAAPDATGFEIGWDHARHRLTPPLAHLHAASPVRQGWQAGHAIFGARALEAVCRLRLLRYLILPFTRVSL